MAATVKQDSSESVSLAGPEPLKAGLPQDLEKQDGQTREPKDDNTEGREKKYRLILVSFSIILLQFLQMIPYGSGITGAANIADQLGISPSNAVWIVASYPLTQGTFVLIGGRSGAIYGHKKAIVAAGFIWVLFQLLAGFMRSVISLSIMRALSGLGGAFIVPNAIALLTITHPPGKLRNISVGLFGAMAPVGAGGGSLFSGFSGQLAPWWWIYFFLQASVQGWTEPYIYSLLVVSFLHFALFVLWEHKFAKDPVLPLNIWGTPSFSAMILSAFLTFMGVGISIWYITAWNIYIRQYTIFSASAAYIPLAIGGCCAAILSAQAIRHIPAQYIMAIGSVATCSSMILIATMPEQQTYWAQVFPAMILCSFGPDFIFTSAQIIASGAVRRHQQGIAGSLLATLLSYGLSTGLGFAGTVEHYTNDDGENLAKGYRNALYLGIGMCGLATLVAVCLVRIPRNRQDGWDEGDKPELK
ncbi:major facilitator superfamily domain-containing protein [Diplogelasinospora grovesii]|uniref:Major facilitator superfamily domain-containing protein n=1 Tax=Diplogelasinospora grovesii TaxID=303347 RepID=A0AAN6NDF0_9PEZI|nr:major facilitator superfamily domain-containing protein [Diplogelasinospora grovesii]